MTLLQQVLDALADENGAEGLTELLRTASRDDLATAETEALDLFDSMREGDELSDDTVAVLESLANAVETIHGEGTRREEAAAEIAERINAVAERIRPSGEAAPPVDETDETETDDAEERELVDVTASTGARRPTTRVNVADLARLRRRPAPPEQESTTGPKFSDVFTASADVPGFANGHGFKDFTEFAAAFEKRAQGRPTTKVGVAQIKKFGFKERIPEGATDITPYLKRAADPANLTAAGWCSPSETWYDLCPTQIATTGLFSLPETNAPRGGVRYSKGFDLSTISASGFAYTESQLIAGGLNKPCIVVPCPTFENEVRLGVEGICIATDIPLDSTYPEAVASFLEIALALHAKTVSGNRLLAVINGSTNKGTIGDVSEGATAAFFNSLDLTATNYRNVHSANWDQLVEVILPTWVKSILRADFIKRNGIDASENAIIVADATINSGLALRNVQVQWLNTSHPGDPNDVFQTPANYAVSGASVTTQWPAAVVATMYFPGSWMALTKDVIDVSTIYDSVGLSANRYTQLFMENGVAVINRCNKSWKFTIPLCPNGVTAAMASIICALP